MVVGNAAGETDIAIDICAFAVMSNHVHLVLHVDVEKSQGWSNKQVLAL